MHWEWGNEVFWWQIQSTKFKNNGHGMQLPFLHTLRSEGTRDEGGTLTEDRPGRKGARQGRLPCVGSGVVYAESAVLPHQRAGPRLALAVEIQAQGGFCFPVHAVALCL